MNLDFTEAGDIEWQWCQLGRMQICTSLQTDKQAGTQLVTQKMVVKPVCVYFV